MPYKAGDEVIVTSEGVNKVGVVLDRRVINKSSVYDVLLENRSALVMLNTSNSMRNYINKNLTEKLCESGQIQSTIPYKDLVANEQLPHLDANSAGKASW
jgi:hypothetical protein